MQLGRQGRDHLLHQADEMGMLFTRHAVYDALTEVWSGKELVGQSDSSVVVPGPV